jgi:predicted  nucleic acid-binding Zn-ribbon protein
VQEPFRCTACGELSPAATRCAACGAASFELVRNPMQADGADEPIAEPVSLQAARAERERRASPNRD